MNTWGQVDHLVVNYICIQAKELEKSRKKIVSS